MEIIHKQNIRSKILLVMPLFGLLIFGYVLSTIVANVLFVKRLGADLLPYVYIVNAVLTPIVAVMLAGVINRFSSAKLISVLTGFGAIVFGVNLFLIYKDLSWSYVMLLAVVQLLYMVLSGIAMWDMALKICSPLEAKRTFNYYGLGASLGGIIAGIFSSYFSEKIGTESLIFAVILSLIIALANSIIIQIKYSKELMPDPDQQKQSAFESLKEGFRYYHTSKLAKYIFLIILLFQAVHWIGEFEFQNILGSHYGEDAFAQISGYVSIVENALLIFVFLFLQKSILDKIGVIRTLTFSPIVILIPFFILFFFPYVLIANSVKIIIKLINYSTFSSSIRMIYTAIPNAIRSSVTTFIGGYSESGGMFMAGVVLLALSEWLNDKWIIGIGIGLLFAMIAIIFFLKKEYVNDLKRNLHGDKPRDIHNAIENFAEPIYKKIGVQELMKMVQHEKLDNDTVRKIVFALGKINNVNVIPSLLEIFHKYDVTVKYTVIEAIHSFDNLNKRLNALPFTRLNLIEAYQEIFLREEDNELKIMILHRLKDFNPDDVIIFLRNAMKDKKSEIKYQAIKAMKYFNDRGIVQYVKPFLDDSNPMIKASSIISLWQFKELRPQLMKKFVEIMSSATKENILATLLIIAKLRITWESDWAKNHLNNQDLGIQTMAALTLMEIDDISGIKIIIDNLVKDTPFSILVARNLKQMSAKTKDRLLTQIHGMSDDRINICVKNLENSYLNFTEEIEYLTGNKAGISRFTGKILTTVNYIKHK